MSAGVPDGWTVWRKTWTTAELVAMPSADMEPLLATARREAEAEGLEVVGGELHRQGELVSVVFHVRPADGSEPATFRE